MRAWHCSSRTALHGRAICAAVAAQCASMLGGADDLAGPSACRAQVPCIAASIPEPAAHVVGLWLFDEGEGPDEGEPAPQTKSHAHRNWGVYDQSGHGNHGYRGPLDASRSLVLAEMPAYSTDVPAKYASPYRLDQNYSLDFSPSETACVVVPDAAALEVSGDFTIELWVQFHSLDGDQTLLSKQTDTGPASGYALAWMADNRELAFRVGTSAGEQSVRSRAFEPVAGQWYHVAGVHSAAGELRLYVDGALNNSCAAAPAVVANDASLWMGGDSSGKHPARARLDEVRISDRVVPPAELGAHGSSGPGAIVFGDSFSLAQTAGELASYGSGTRNRWRWYARAAGSISLVHDMVHSAGGAVSLDHHHADREGSPNELSLYYNAPLACTRDVPVVSISGWVSFDDLDAAGRLIFLNQVWTGHERHYGVRNTNLAAAVEYWSNEKVWKVNTASGSKADFSKRVEYGDDPTRFHYFELTADFLARRFVSFQFDACRWDLSSYSIYVEPGQFTGVLPVMDVNVRLMTADPPPERPYSAKFVVDDVAITIDRARRRRRQQ